MTIGLLLENHVDNSRTASFFGSEVVVVRIVVVTIVVIVAVVVVEAAVVVGSMHSYELQGHPDLQLV